MQTTLSKIRISTFSCVSESSVLFVVEICVDRWVSFSIHWNLQFVMSIRLFYWFVFFCLLPTIIEIIDSKLKKAHRRWQQLHQSPKKLYLMSRSFSSMSNMDYYERLSMRWGEVLIRWFWSVLIDVVRDVHMIGDHFAIKRSLLTYFRDPQNQQTKFRKHKTFTRALLILQFSMCLCTHTLHSTILFRRIRSALQSVWRQFRPRKFVTLFGTIDVLLIRLDSLIPFDVHFPEANTHKRWFAFEGKKRKIISSFQIVAWLHWISLRWNRWFLELRWITFNSWALESYPSIALKTGLVVCLQSMQIELQWRRTLLCSQRLVVFDVDCFTVHSAVVTVTRFACKISSNCHKHTKPLLFIIHSIANRTLRCKTGNAFVYKWKPSCIVANQFRKYIDFIHYVHSFGGKLQMHAH